jgi:hypothetical protein
MVRARVGDAAGRALADLLPLCRAVPERARARVPWQAEPLSRRDFDRLDAAAQRLYRSLEAPRSGA